MIFKNIFIFILNLQIVFYSLYVHSQYYYVCIRNKDVAQTSISVSQIALKFPIK